MTVKQLIEELKKYPEDMIVIVYDYDESRGPVVKVTPNIGKRHEYGVNEGQEYLELESIDDV